MIGNRLWRTLEDFGPARPDNAGPRRVATVGESLGQLLATNSLSRHEFPKLLALPRGQRHAADRSFDFRPTESESEDARRRSFPIKNLEHSRIM